MPRSEVLYRRSWIHFWGNLISRVGRLYVGRPIWRRQGSGILLSKKAFATIGVEQSYP